MDGEYRAPAVPESMVCQELKPGLPAAGGREPAGTRKSNREPEAGTKPGVQYETGSAAGNWRAGAGSSAAAAPDDKGRGRSRRKFAGRICVGEFKSAFGITSRISRSGRPGQGIQVVRLVRGRGGICWFFIQGLLTWLLARLPCTCLVRPELFIDL